MMCQRTSKTRADKRRVYALGAAELLRAFAALLAVFAFNTTLEAQIKQIHYSSELQDYELSFDSRKLAGYDMQGIVWLSPYYAPDRKGPFLVAVGEIGSPSVDKVFLAPSVESYDKTAGEQEPVLGTAEFRAQASKNLSYGEGEVRKLSEMKIPSVLEPVRAYLLDFLDLNLAIQRLRASYIETGDTRSLKALLCKHCVCGSEETALSES